MPVKTVDMPGIGKIALFKRKNSRTIRINMSVEGNVKVTLPYYAPYSAALRFVEAKRSWILSQQAHAVQPIIESKSIGKNHRLFLEYKFNLSKPSGRLTDETITIQIPSNLIAENAEVQAIIKRYIVKALRSEAEKILPERTRQFSRRFGYEVRGISIRQLKGRWGSCNTKKELTFNLYLMHLPWHLIDYVIVHELVHTKIMHHGIEFWQEMESRLPNAKDLRHEIRNYKPTV